MTASKTYPVPENILQSTHLTASQYDEMYKQSVEQPEAFWAEHASMLEWYQKPTKIKNTMFGESDVSIKWFEDGELMPAITVLTAIWLTTPQKLLFTGKATHQKIAKISRINKYTTKFVN